MTEQEKIQFLKLQARILQLEEAVADIKEQYGEIKEVKKQISMEEIKQLEAE